ncbi:MAG: AI-2E family transporter [Prochloraceae cyanobacterium]|nr:AI-2E family transporter [Prochloraceae cyanobacterium]
MFLANPEPYRQGFKRLFPSFYRQRVQEIIDRCENSLQSWLTAILLKMSSIGFFCFIGLSILEIPLALSQAILAGLLSFIPYIGPVLSVIPPISLALLDEPQKAWNIIFLYLILHWLINYLLSNWLIKKGIFLLPGVILLAQLFFTISLGVFGLVLALPLTIVGKICFQEVLLEDILDRWQLQNSDSMGSRE